jgi:hypothetical protein
MVKLSELRYGPIRHASLPPELLNEIRDVYEQVGRYVTPTLEEFEVAFMRDAHPAREVGVWKCIAKASADYREQYFGGQPASDDDAVKCITALTLISMDVTDAARLKLPKDVAVRLVECFGRAWDERRNVR